jgi:hypothetical protein
MDVEEQIEGYIAGQPEPKRTEMHALHRSILRLAPDCKLCFLDGRNAEGKTVSNPNIGYGLQTIRYAGGGARDFYRLGMSANTAGISLYVMGLEDKKYLSETYGPRLGKASVTGYCIKFRSVENIDMDVLEEVIRFALAAEPPSLAS